MCVSIRSPAAVVVLVQVAPVLVRVWVCQLYAIQPSPACRFPTMKLLGYGAALRADIRRDALMTLLTFYVERFQIG